MKISRDPEEEHGSDSTGYFEDALCELDAETFRKFYSWMAYQEDSRPQFVQHVAGALLKIYYDELEETGKYPNGKAIRQILVENEFECNSYWYASALSEFFYKALEKGGVGLAFESNILFPFSICFDDFLSVESMLLYFKTESENSTVCASFRDILRMSNLEYMKVLIEKALSGEIVLHETFSEVGNYEPDRVASKMVSVMISEYSNNKIQRLFATIIKELLSEGDKMEILFSIIKERAIAKDSISFPFMLFCDILDSMPRDQDFYQKLIKRVPEREKDFHSLLVPFPNPFRNMITHVNMYG